MTKKEFVPAFEGLCETVGVKSSKPRMAIYYEILKGLTVDEWNQAVIAVLENRVYSSLPMPAELLQAVRGVPEDRALLALQVLERGMRYHGSVSAVRFEDPLINEVVSRWEGGWPGICSITLDQWEFQKKDFMKQYMALMRTGHRGSMEALPSRFDVDNAARGYDRRSKIIEIPNHEPERVAIGHETRAIEYEPKPEDCVGVDEEVRKLINKLGEG